MAAPDQPGGAGSSGRHRAPDAEAQTAYIPRITDASPDGVPGGPLAPPIGLGSPTAAVRPVSPPSAAAPPTVTPPVPSVTPPPTPAAAETAVLRADEEVQQRIARSGAAPEATQRTPHAEPRPAGQNFDFFAAAAAAAKPTATPSAAVAATPPAPDEAPQARNGGFPPRTPNPVIKSAQVPLSGPPTAAVQAFRPPVPPSTAGHNPGGIPTAPAFGNPATPGSPAHPGPGGAPVTPGSPAHPGPGGAPVTPGSPAHPGPGAPVTAGSPAHPGPPVTPGSPAHPGLGKPQDPNETAVIRTADAPTGLLPMAKRPTEQPSPVRAPTALLSAIPGVAAHAAKAKAEPDVVLGAASVAPVSPGGPRPPAEDEPVADEPKRGEKVVRLRAEQTGEGYKSVYSELTRPTVGSRIRGGIRVSGELMITFGLIVLLFAGYEVFGNSAKVQDEQNALADELDQVWNDPTVGPTPAAAPSKGPAAPGSNLVGRLYIPKFDKEWVVVDGVQPDDIRYAPGHYPDSAKPGQVGNFSVAGHRIKKIFWRLDELKSGDVIGVETRSNWYVYRVYDQDVVKPSQVEVVAPVPGKPKAKPTRSLLTLTTCNPKYNNYERLIIHAELVATSKRDQKLPDAGMPAEVKKA